MDISMPVKGRYLQLTTFDQVKKSKTISVFPGERKTIVQTHDIGIAERIWLTFPGWFWQHWDTQAAIDPTLLRKLILRIYLNNSAEPSVAAPVGDFFGVGHCEYRHYTSDMLGMSSGGFYSYFPMPFDGGLRIEIENLHQSMRADIFCNVNYRQLDSIESERRYFHCEFRCGELEGSEPIEIADISGRGHFAGCCLSIQGKELNYLSYLEAPEYIYIDSQQEGIQRSAVVGTGLEDYFGGGWYFRDGEFCAATHGVPLKDTLRSMISMYRFHQNDPIPFERSLRFSFVNPWDSDRLKPFIYSSTAYYYLDSAQGVPPLPSVDKLTRLYRIRDVDYQSIP